MSNTTIKNKPNTRPNAYRITGQYNINDVKFDLLKIIQPYDGYMYNEVETNKLISVFNSYLGDLKRSYKIFSFEIANTEKENAITFDIQIKMQKDRSPKKLKIHVGKIDLTMYMRKPETEGTDA